MSDPIPSQPVEPWQTLRPLVEQVTTRFPISQAVPTLADTFDWLLDRVASEGPWLGEQQNFERQFFRRWEAIASRALERNPRQASDRALKDPDYNPLGNSQPWGVELTRAFRAAFKELVPLVDVADGVLPDEERMRAYARMMNTLLSSLVLPVISYAPLIEIEWQAILEKLNDLIALTLAFEGAVVVWLIGGFARDVEGRLQLHPKLSFAPPASGTRVKPLYVLLGTPYEEQCPTLRPLGRSEGAAADEPRLSDSLLEDTPWHRVTVQIAIPVEDYRLFNLTRLNDAEREIARQIDMERRPRAQHVLSGSVHPVPRPWGAYTPVQPEIATPAPAVEAFSAPEVPTPSPVSRSPGSGPLPPSTPDSLHQDADRLRRKGMATLTADPAIAQKYLLASTVLDNTSVDVWLKLVELATGAKQKESFRREAEKVLRRQHQNG